MIGYYIHHQGSGHRTRAEAIARHLSAPVVALSSADIVGEDFTDVIALDRDDQNLDPRDPTAGGVLHWAPRGDRGLCRRMAQIARFADEHEPAAVVVDVSVEIALFVRLLGVPVIVVAMPGDRADPTHRRAYEVADAIIAPWPGDLYSPPWLDEFISKTTFVGGISRFEYRPATPDPALASDVLLMSGTGGESERPVVSLITKRHPGLTVVGLGPAFGTWTDDPWPYLCSAQVVVINAGQGSVADVAAARRPAVVIPQRRPFAEQDATACTLEREGLAQVRSEWPEPDDWAKILHESSVTNADWSRWQTDGAAGRAAAAIEALLR
ncbi:hypothetical protein [Gordonia sp. NPDC003429]|nr:hypothetical protein [Gordonia polyisoprenivorans]